MPFSIRKSLVIEISSESGIFCRYSSISGNKSGKEIAADLKMSPDNVRMAIVRAKRKAKKAMESEKDSQGKT